MGKLDGILWRESYSRTTRNGWNWTEPRVWPRCPGLDGLWNTLNTLFPYPLRRRIFPPNTFHQIVNVSGGAPDDVCGRIIADQNTDEFHTTTIYHKTCLDQNED